MMWQDFSAHAFRPSLFVPTLFALFLYPRFAAHGVGSMGEGLPDRNDISKQLLEIEKRRGLNRRQSQRLDRFNKLLASETTRKRLEYQSFFKRVFTAVGHRGTIFAATCSQRRIVGCGQKKHDEYINALKGVALLEFLEEYPLPEWLGVKDTPADADDVFRTQVLAQLKETYSHGTQFQGTHGEKADTITRELLEKATLPNTDLSQGVVEAFFCTGDEAARLVEPWSCDTLIITDGQQPFQWNEGSQQISQIFRRMGPLYGDVSVRLPSRSSTAEPSEIWDLRKVRERFIDRGSTDEPLALDVRSPLPPTILPKFLTGENC